MALNTNTNYYDNGSLSKPPQFSRDNFSLWKNRMMLFLEGADPTIPEYIENGPYEPVRIIAAVPVTATTEAVPERYVVKEIRQWSDEDKKKVGIDARAKTIISMALPDEVFHSIMHLKTSKEMWETICVQYEGTTEIQETRKINLVRQYESFIAGKNESLSDVHQRFNCLIIDLRTVGRTYSNSEVLTKFLECFPESWDSYSICFKLTKDLNSLSLSTLYGILLNYEQSNLLKKNLVKDSKDSKSTPVALVSSEIIPSQRSTLTITELDSESEDLSDPDLSEFDESLALLTNSFKRFARKSNFRKSKPLSLTEKPKSTPVDKATATCYNCEKIGHFSSECRSKKVFKPSTSRRSSDDKYLKLKNKYQKLKSYKRKGKRLIAEEHDWAESEESSFDEEVFANLCLMAEIKEEVEEASEPSMSYISSQDVTKEESSSLKFGTFVTSFFDTSYNQLYPYSSSNSIPEEISKDTKSADKGKSILPQKATRKAKLKVTSKPSANQSSSSVIEIFDLCPPKLKIDLKSTRSEEMKIPPRSHEKSLLGPGPAHLKLSKPTTSADKTAKVKINASKAEKVTKVEKSTKVKNTTKGSKGIWYLDSGCSRHMTGQKDLLTEYKEEKGPSVIFGGNGKGYTRGFGVLSNGTTTFRRVAYVDGLKHNLLSISQLCDKDYEVRFSKKACSVVDEKGKLALSGYRRENVYVIDMDSTITENLCFLSKASSDVNWHSDTPEELTSFVKKMEVLNNLTVRSIRSDHGTEFKKSSLNNFFENKGISHNFSTVRTTQQNGAEDVNTACFTQNRSLIVKRFGKTSYELFHGRKPSISFLHIFGCQCYILNNRDQLGKFDPKAADGIFLGYSSISKAYRVFNKRRQSVEETIHVTFDETHSANSKPITDNEELNAWMFSHYKETEPFFSNHQHSDPQTVDDDPNIIPRSSDSNSWVSAEPLNTLLPSDLPLSENLSDNNSLSTTQQLIADELQTSSSVNIPIVDSTSELIDHAPAQRWTRYHPIDQILGDPDTGIQTRLSSGNIYLFVNFLSLIEPKKTDDALRDPNWVSAMHEELTEFSRNKVWNLIPRPSDKTVIGTKWVFRNKLDEHGTVTRNKARLVA
ncbi:hypothetical protein L6452_37702 [Arctium lappa]|uniref:Uncharacterized protein n=1 Tax=Arctium lappa TaxID=4217 RepID=A0ACB8Y3Q8_ARCLA|nr:hypothetical protein L6452_37702 [Arctium lappa]